MRTKTKTQSSDSKVKISTPGSKLAKEWIKRVASPKEWSRELGMKSERTIYKWASGQEPIPEERAAQILMIAKKFVIPIAMLRDETDLYLLSMNDPGSF